MEMPYPQPLAFTAVSLVDDTRELHRIEKDFPVIGAQSSDDRWIGNEQLNRLVRDTKRALQTDGGLSEIADICDADPWLGADLECKR